MYEKCSQTIKDEDLDEVFFFFIWTDLEKCECVHHIRRVKNTWKPYLSKSTDTLQWKWLHYKLQATNSKITWVKVLEYLILTVLKYFT